MHGRHSRCMTGVVLESKVIPRMYRIVVILLGVCSASGIAFGCTQLPAGTSLWVRLSQPVSSYSAKPGMSVSGFVLESPTCDGVSIFPTQVPVEGRICFRTSRRSGSGSRNRESGALNSFVSYLRRAHPSTSALESMKLTTLEKA